jgi:hypothetical protein
MHKGKKIILLPLTPNEISQCDRAIGETAKRESKYQHDQTAPPSSSNAIKLESGAMLATRSDLFPPIVDAPFHASVCRQVLFSHDDITTPLPRAITNLMQKFKDIFPAEIPPGLPPLRGIEHQIDLIPRATWPNHAAYRTNPEETMEIQRQVQDLLDHGYVQESLLPSFLLFWFLSKMVLGACVLIVEPLTILPFAIIFLYLG